jgi:hypothetical protein
MTSTRVPESHSDKSPRVGVPRPLVVLHVPRPESHSALTYGGLPPQLAFANAMPPMNPEVVALAKRLRRRNPKTGERKSFPRCCDRLAKFGNVNNYGRPFAAESIPAMIRPR